jgi:hypothetical protein
MAKRVRIQVFPDGRIQADIHGIKGKKCADYIRVLEEILDAKTVDSEYTPEYFEVEEVQETSTEQQKVGEG